MLPIQILSKLLIQFDPTSVKNSTTCRNKADEIQFGGNPASSLLGDLATLFLHFS
jgi:hypothetical protein